MASRIASSSSQRGRLGRGLRAAAGMLALAVSAAQAASGSPQFVAPQAIAAGDTAWMLTSTAIVLMMTLPGLAFFYGGLVRKKNILGTMTQVFIAAAVVTVLWFLLGYTLAFSTGSPWLGALAKAGGGSLFLPDPQQVPIHALAPSVPESVFAMFQCAFAVITAALVVGAFAERVRFGVAALFCGIWSLVVYAPVAHWVWHPDGWLYGLGVRDFAGGLVVHVNAGAAALACALAVGPRRGWGREPMIPSNLAYMLIGASFLWIGWFGFNGGSALAANANAGLAITNTQIAAALGAVVFVSLEWLTRGQATLVGLSTGAVAGLVAVTPAAGYISVPCAYLFGLLGGGVAYVGLVWVKPMIDVDDSLDVFTIHGMVGIAGSLATPFLSQEALVGAPGKPLAELAGTAVVLVYSFTVSWVLMKLLHGLANARVQPQEEIDGLDLSQHGETIE